MSLARRSLPGLVALVAATSSVPLGASAQMIAPNPYATVPGVWAELPDGRTWGATSAI